MKGRRSQKKRNYSCDHKVKQRLSPGIKFPFKSSPYSDWNNEWNGEYKNMKEISWQFMEMDKLKIRPSMRHKLQGILARHITYRKKILKDIKIHS